MAVMDNSVFQRLTADPNDAAGAFAYIAYKRQKVEFCKAFGDRAPTREELVGFHTVACLHTSIEAYRSQGEAIAESFFKASLDELAANAMAATFQHTLYRKIESGNVSLAEKLAAIGASLGEKRTLLAWFRDVSGNLMVNMVSIFVIGAVLLGYRFSAELQQGAERKAGVSGSNASQNPARAQPALPDGLATPADPPNP
jgi:hypothetical protein